jgi:signal transduction histidine kinase
MAFEQGGVDYIEKPLRSAEVLARVKAHLRIRFLARQQEEQTRKLQDTYAELREMENLRDSLVHMTAHDMRSPLSIVTGYLYLLRQNILQHLSDVDLRYVDLSIDSCQTLARMIDNMIDVSRIESGNMSLHKESVDPVEIVRDMAEEKIPIEDTAGVVMESESDSCRLECDPGLIRRVLSNLVYNAQRFAPKDVPVRIRMSSSEKDARVSVIDTGPGIAPEHHTLVFDKFFQATNPHFERKFTSGLGLTFCKLAVEMHGGGIGLNSSVGHGCEFWFTLPR